MYIWKQNLHKKMLKKYLVKIEEVIEIKVDYIVMLKQIQEMVLLNVMILINL